MTPADGPNIVVINLDDADVDLLGRNAIQQFFPNIQRHLLDGGMLLNDFHVSAPVCGPSRASLFRGQYPHNTGIELNELGTDPNGPTGSWAEFLDRGYADDEIGVWMRRSGYATALVGKYHHTQFPAASGNLGFVPPGWGDFRASSGGGYFAQPRFINGVRIETGDDEYRTDLETVDMVEIIEDHDGERPLFLYVAPYAPHADVSGAPIYPDRYADAFADEMIPSTPDLNEADLSDKPAIFQNAEALTAERMAGLHAAYRDRLRAMAAVDDMVGELFAVLEGEGMTDDTYVFLTSDNGYQLGHHRQTAKRDAFDRTTRVGLLAAGPAITPGSGASDVLTHVDLTATILDLAGADRPGFLDGVSFAPLLIGDPFEPSRSGVLVEGEGIKVIGGVRVAIEYDAWRGEDEIYVEHRDGSREYYDLATDPHQLENRWDELSETERSELEAHLASIRDCHGPTCRGGSALPAVETVTEIADYTDGVLTLSGSATALSGVDRVVATIRRVDDNRYWNGDALVAEPVQIDLPTEPAGDGATWRYAAGLPATDYWVGVWAIDRNGNVDPRIDADIVVGTPPLDPAPRARFTVETGSIVPEGRTVISGEVERVSGDRAAINVLVRVRRTDIDFGGHWNGDQWIEDPNTWLLAELDGDQWRYAIDLEPGSYLLHAYAVDTAGGLQTWDHGRDAIEIMVG
ncbi:MAG: sulfatase-like hydrolase/transferase [Actinomycetota bacterium]